MQLRGAGAQVDVLRIEAPGSRGSRNRPAPSFGRGARWGALPSPCRCAVVGRGVVAGVVPFVDPGGIVAVFWVLCLRFFPSMGQTGILEGVRRLLNTFPLGWFVGCLPGF